MQHDQLFNHRVNNKAIEVAKEIGAFGILGMAYLNVGL